MERCAISFCNSFVSRIPEEVQCLQQCFECRAAGIPESIYCKIHDQHNGGMFCGSHFTDYAAVHNVTEALKENPILRQSLFVRSAASAMWGIDKYDDEWFTNEVVSLCFLKQWSARDILGNSYNAVQNRMFIANNVRKPRIKDQKLGVCVFF